MPIGFFSVGYTINLMTVWRIIASSEKRRRSERIAECQMKAECIPEGRSIKISSTVGRVREMQRITDVEPKDEHVHIVTKAYTGTRSDIVEKMFPFELSTGTCMIVTHKPDISHIEEDRSIQITDQSETVFGIRFELNIADLIDICIRIVTIGGKTSGTYATDRKSTDAVCSAYIELLAVRCLHGVAVTVNHTATDTESKSVITVNIMVVTKFGRDFQKL